MSSPDSPSIQSLPSSPFSASDPSPPNNRSAPRPPKITSLPPPPDIESFPSNPQITSFPAVPTSVSAAGVPVIVHAVAAAEGRSPTTTPTAPTKITSADENVINFPPMNQFYRLSTQEDRCSDQSGSYRARRSRIGRRIMRQSGGDRRVCCTSRLPN